MTLRGSAGPAGEYSFTESLLLSGHIGGRRCSALQTRTCRSSEARRKTNAALASGEGPWQISQSPSTSNRADSLVEELPIAQLPNCPLERGQLTAAAPFTCRVTLNAESSALSHRGGACCAFRAIGVEIIKLTILRYHQVVSGLQLCSMQKQKVAENLEGRVRGTSC
ncbi:hypothetical protein BP00DRAFT_202547 [Aspergillus indologenus CBS 114.80]|uniref:Uncharacterized protein n=1 Tax=Aspergillus indologenus CBS 114.80 TaxID=1450541 RepID=A0A2V5J0T0_9EURO|nr:hypothetical protein BP00DRAFT_202547 [Aspergillus indologenus CBS 114.80]